MSNAAVRLIDRHVEGSLGHKPAFDFNEKTYSYHDVAALANRAGNLLKSLGIGAGARVVMLLPQSPAYVATLVGAMKVGAIPVVIFNASASAAAAKGAALAVVHEKFIREFSSELPKEKV